MGLRNAEKGLEERESRVLGRTGSPRDANADNEEDPAVQDRPVEPPTAQLDRLATQISGLQRRLDACIARRNEAIADRASKHVASIVTAAEQSAAEIRAAAEYDAVAIRDWLLAEARTEVDRVRREAQADAARVRTEAQVEAARTREKAMNLMSAEIESVCARLSDELQAGARSALAEIVGEPRAPAETDAALSPPHPSFKEVARELEHAVKKLQNAAAVLERR